MTQPPKLPLPPLDETCERFLKQLKPLADGETFARTCAAVETFRNGEGKPLHRRLSDVAAKAERSWLIDAWLESYLAVRTPPPLSTNVAFSIRTQDKDLGAWAAALTAVCADYHHARIPAPETPQGTPFCMEQWRILRGAARIPQQGVDSFRIAPAPGRHIGVFYNGFYYRFAALDDNGEAYRPDVFKQALAKIQADGEKNPFPVAVPSYLGGDHAAEVYQTLLAGNGNALLAEYLATDLFHITITDQSADTDQDLADAVFAPQQNIWCYKPITLCFNTATRRLFLHCEHTWQDGGALKGIIARAADYLDRQTGSNHPSDTARFGWKLNADQQKHWAQWQQDYAERAAKMRVKSVTVPFDTPLPKSISRDALMQLLLQYAQLTVYGRIRNTYEAVDVSHFSSGRTECVRPVSEASAAFAASLLDNKPNIDLLEAALAEHKSRIKTAKQAHGANRCLLGLQLTAQQYSERLPDLFQDEGYRIFTTDFLSTSTLGDDAIIINFAFAPTSAGGLGVNYTLSQNGWLYTVSYPEEQEEEVKAFVDALLQGGMCLQAFLTKAV